ncbi:DUF3368 domain-containing protein [Limosilactobacillus agrestis]|uniref:DUF3368 domain-containing protein n=1 Tax=Limosilactobacillus agrestis TaxID=2759748 RepID=A0A7W3UHP1_9LACO|nr:DUF3368 domain-containing protein [Limosilactobacillus agrestis]MBD5090974.1 DUF3368 domain-containing protein [Lactobacillus sp.]MBB1095824.1 DUF3368 domain-containing protein [Limosilactobacillus agrestis]MBB1098855.1 DUF3368 domain-containing protein [Limosilactobacillus agrestis]MCD7113526.1 DUF3368 domain-containing protein [Limosilactobacillus agrestis]MCD7125820.1 DUF3368 domain-containing protein [Limosilactobacillus agrestis]
MTMTYNELSTEAKETALNSFVNFYVSQYNKESLEILGSHVENGLIATINQILRDNQFMGHSKLVEISIRLSKPVYQEILSQLTNVKFQKDGEPVVDWLTAWKEKEEQLPEED